MPALRKQKPYEQIIGRRMLVNGRKFPQPHEYEPNGITERHYYYLVHGELAIDENGQLWIEISLRAAGYVQDTIGSPGS